MPLAWRQWSARSSWTKGYAPARDFVTGTVLRQMDRSAVEGAPLNAKSALQEAAQSQGKATPSYRTEQSGGADHEPVFTAEVVVEGEVLGQGTGARKADAEREAAAQALETLERERR